MYNPEYSIVQHFYVRENRMWNKFKGFSTVHPFACIAIGFNSNLHAFAWRATAIMMPSNTQFSKEKARIAVLAMMKSSSDHPHTEHFTTKEITDLGRVSNLFDALGFKRWNVNHSNMDWEYADRCFKNVILDAQGLRIDDKGKTVPRASRRDDQHAVMQKIVAGQHADSFPG